MKKLKIVAVLWLSLLIAFLYLDCRGYYYGFGQGFFSDKIPSRFLVDFSSYYPRGDGSVYIREKFPSINVLEQNDSISLDDVSKRTYVKKFVGYWFNEKVIIAKIKDEKNRDKYLEIYEEITNALDPKYYCEERRYPPDEYYNLTYIDLEKDLNYFKRFRAVKNLVFILLIFLSVYFLRLVYFKWRKDKDNKNGWW